MTDKSNVTDLTDRLKAKAEEPAEIHTHPDSGVASTGRVRTCNPVWQAMSISTLHRLTIIGACLLYFALLGGMVLLPLLPDHKWQVFIYWVLPLSGIAIAILIFEKTQTPNDY